MDKNIFIIDAIKLAKPKTHIIYKRDKVIIDVKFWKQYRHDVLALYNIPFKEYTTRQKYIKSFFRNL